jgi:hypothetical protein
MRPDFYDPDEQEHREERWLLRRRADRAARTVEEQQRWEDDAPLRRRRELARLHAAGVRAWWPRLRPGQSLARWAVEYEGARAQHSCGAGYVDRRAEAFATRTWADACDTLDKRVA